MQAFNAKSVANKIKRNVARVNAGMISWEEFGRLNRAAWDSVSMGEQHIVRSACAERHYAVSRLLGFAA